MGGEAFFRGIHRFVVGFTLVQLVVIGAFVLVGPWWTVRAGLPGATLLIAALGLLFDWRALDVLLARLPTRAQRAGVRLAVASHLVVSGWALVLLLKPLDPAWTALAGTEDWSDPRLAFTADGALVVLTGSGRLWRRDGDDWDELASSPGGFAWEFYAGPDGALWSGPRGVTRLDRFDVTTATWRSIGRPAGELAALAVGTGELLVIVDGALHRLDLSVGTWAIVQDVRGRADSVALDANSGSALVLGRRWWSREGGVWREVTPTGELGRADAAVAGGWRYASSGGMWSGDLRVAAPGEELLKRRSAPAADVRVLVTDPDMGTRAVAGSWGQGVWVTADGGQTWADLGLDRVQVRSIAVDWSRGKVCAASSNLIWDRGLYCRDLPHGQASAEAAARGRR